MFNCNCCEFKTDRKSNYDSHLKTKKHLKKLEISTNDSQIITNDAPININNNYTCEYCNSSYTKSSSLNRHQQSCVKKQLEEKSSQLEEKSSQLEEKSSQLEEKSSQIKLIIETNDKLFNKLKDVYESDIKELKEENKILNDKLHNVKDQQLSVLQNNLKPSNNNNTQIIIHNYPNAPNLGFPDNIPVDESLQEYIQLGGVKGLGKFISDHWAKDINPIDRSIWMVDSSRNKFLIRCKDVWIIDVDGKQFQELNIKRIHKIFDDYLQSFDSYAREHNYYEYVKTMEFIVDIKTKNMIVKGLKDAGKYLIYDKEKFPHTEPILETLGEPILETLEEPIADSLAEPTAEPIAESIAEITDESIRESIHDSIREIIQELNMD